MRFVLYVLCAAPLVCAALPEPPAQHQDWTAPLAPGIPDYVMRTTDFLFNAGLADPRGGEYREVEIARLKTHAWVFPGGYAVGWNGLVYPVLNAGPLADLASDVGIVAGAEPWSGRIALRREPTPERAGFWFRMEGPGTLAPLSIALLLRLGRPELALELWQAPESKDFWNQVHPREKGEPEWMNTAVTSWLGTAFWRFAFDWERGEDREAVEVGESLLLWEQHESLRLSFLRTVPELMADSKRRLSAPARPHVDFAPLLETGKTDDPALAALLKKPQAAWITELIDRLDDVHGDKLTFSIDLLSVRSDLPFVDE